MRPEDLYQLHKQRVYHLCLRYCGGQIALAEDLTQDVFLKMLEHMNELTDPDTLAPWLYRVAANTCFTRMKREGAVWNKVRQWLTAQTPTETWSTPEKQVQIKEELHSSLRTLQTIPAKERIVFCMHVLDGAPQSEIASTLSLSKGYVSKLLQRARTHIQRKDGEQERACHSL